MNKKMIFVILTLFSLCFSFEYVRAEKLVVKEADYSEQYKKWLSLSESKRKKAMEPGKYVTNSKFFDLPKAGAKAMASYENSRFDLRDYSLVTNAKFQGSSSACWTFATMASVESNALVNGFGEYDLSEAHLELATQNSLFDSLLPFEREFNAGGFDEYGAVYFSNRIGPVLEDDVPFSLVNNTINGVRTATLKDISDKNSVLVVNDYTKLVLALGGTCDADAILSIKKYLTTNGALAAYMYWDDNSYKLSGDYYYYYYNSDTYIDNHEVAIIGWDDNISASSFKNSNGKSPSRNGAFIIKNSNINKYMYISYDDSIICSMINGFFNVNKDFNDNVYIHDVLGVNNQHILYEDINLANKFTKKSNKTELLKKIMIYGTMVGQEYDLLVSNSGQLDDLEIVKSGTIDHVGYTTIDLSSLNIKLTNNDFAVAVKYHKYYGWNVIPSYSKAYGYGADVATGKSFLSTDGISWTQLQDDSNDDAYASIKAYTDNTNEAINSYTATFSYDDGIESVGNNTISCESSGSGCSIVLPSITPKSNYNVSGWYYNDEKIGNPGDNYTLTGNITLYAFSQKNDTTYTVTFNGGDGILSISNNELSCTSSSGSCIVVLPSVTLDDDYTFDGWYSDSSLTLKVGNVEDNYNVSGNTILYAKAVKNQIQVEDFTVSFELTDGIEETSKSDLTCKPSSGSCKIVLPTLTISSGYEMLGWYDSSTGGTKVGNMGDNYTVTGNITLYARTKKTSTGYTVSFELPEGYETTIPAAVCNVSTNKCEVTLPEVSVPKGYEMLGWYSKISDTLVGKPGDKYELDDNVTLYAKIVAISNDDPSVTNDLEIVFIDNENNVISDGNNPGTGNEKLYVVLALLGISLGAFGYYSYNYFKKKKSI